mgnify:CR=1 FL=1
MKTKKLKIEELKVESFVTKINNKETLTIQGALGDSNNNCYNTDVTCWADINGNHEVDNLEPIISVVFTRIGICPIIEFYHDTMTGI